MNGGDEPKNTRAILFRGGSSKLEKRRLFFGDFGEDTKEHGEKTSKELGSLRTTIFMFVFDFLSLSRALSFIYFVLNITFVELYFGRL